MIFSYGRSLALAAGVVAIPLSVPSNASKLEHVPDPRIAAVRTFLTKLNCPIAGLAKDFVRVADENHLDWRLLPSIAVVESGGGKAYRHNNIFGWNGGNQAFPSIQYGLQTVASRLGNSPLYRRCDSLGKLHIYNEDKDYAVAVLHVMKRISPQATLN